MPTRNNPPKTEAQIEKEKDKRVLIRIAREAKRREYYVQRDSNLVEKMADIIQNSKNITRWSLFVLMALPQAQFYNIQRACLLKYNKTISYDKKAKAYCFCVYMPTIEIKQKIRRLEKVLTV